MLCRVMGDPHIRKGLNAAAHTWIFPGVQHAEMEGEVAAAGRVMLRRVMGKLAFITLRDGSGDVQLYLEKQVMTDNDPEAFR